MDDLAQLGFSVDSAPLKGANSELDKLSKTTAKAERATDKLNNEFERGGKSAGTFAALVSGLKSAVTGLIAAFGVSTLIDITNTWTDLNSRLKIATGSTEAAVVVMERLSDMARRTYSSLGLTAEGYLRNARALQDLGYSTNQTLDFVEAINNALVVSGAKGERAEMVFNALSKAMGLGKLSGEQLETVLTSGGRVTTALADSLGIATTDLRKLGMEGKITGKVLFEALVGQLNKLREEADSMAFTIGDAFLLLGNSITEYVGKMDEAAGVSQAVAGAIITLGDNLETVGKIAVVVGAGMLTAFGPTMVWMVGTALVGAFVALGKAIAANPIGFIATAIVMIITAVWQFRDAIKQAIGVDVEAIVAAAGNFIIRSFLTAFEQIKWIWGTLPNVMGSLTIETVNAVIGGLNMMIKSGVDGINMLINAIPEQLRFGITGISGDFGKIPTMVNNFKALADAGNAAYAANVKAIASTDYVGALVSEFNNLSEATTDVNSALDQMSGGSGSGEGGTVDKAISAIDRLKSSAQLALEAMMEMQKNLQGAVVGAFKGFFKDLMSGKSVVDSLTDALGNLADKLMDMVLDNALNGLLGGLMGGGGMWNIPTGHVPGGFFPGLPQADGGAWYRGVQMFAKGGVVSSPTGFNMASGGTGVMGEAGPEAILPLHRASDGSLGVMNVANDTPGVVFVQPIINNNASDQVSATAGTDDAGNLIVTIDKMVADRIGDPSSRTSKALSGGYGLKRATKGR